MFTIMDLQRLDTWLTKQNGRTLYVIQAPWIFRNNEQSQPEAVQALYRRVESFFGQASDLSHISTTVVCACTKDLLTITMEMLYDDIRHAR